MLLPVQTLKTARDECMRFVFTIMAETELVPANPHVRYKAELFHRAWEQRCRVVNLVAVLVNRQHT